MESELWQKWTMTNRATSARVARSAEPPGGRRPRRLGRRRRPLYRLLARAITGAVERGDVARGARLPSERALAGAVAVSRGVVVAAYDELVADAVIERRPGSGTFVAGPPRSACRPGGRARRLRLRSRRALPPGRQADLRRADHVGAAALPPLDDGVGHELVVGGDDHAPAHRDRGGERPFRREAGAASQVAPLDRPGEGPGQQAVERAGRPGPVAEGVDHPGGSRQNGPPAQKWPCSVMVHFCQSSGSMVKSLAVQRAGSSAIRDLLEITEQPHVLSLAGGLPARRHVPRGRDRRGPRPPPWTRTRWAPCSTARPRATARCGPWVAARHGLATGAAGEDRVLVTSGSQQALDLLTRAVVDPGGTIALADPAYVGALQTFRAAGAQLLAIPADRDGLRVDVLAERLAAGARPTLVYVVANFDNPSGATLAPQRRIDLAALADRYGFWIVDDDPYGELRWSGHRADRPARPHRPDDHARLHVQDPRPRASAPGGRSAPPEVQRAMTVLKQSADLHTSSLNQQIVHRVVTEPGFLPAHIAGLRTTYQRPGERPGRRAARRPRRPADGGRARRRHVPVGRAHRPRRRHRRPPRPRARPRGGVRPRRRLRRGDQSTGAACGCPTPPPAPPTSSGRSTGSLERSGTAEAQWAGGTPPRGDEHVDLTVIAIPAYFGTMGAEYRYLKNQAQDRAPIVGDYTKDDTLASLAMGVGSLLAPLTLKRLVQPVTPGRGKYGKALVATAIGAAAVTTIADVLAKREAAGGRLPHAGTRPWGADATIDSVDGTATDVTDSTPSEPGAGAGAATPAAAWPAASPGRPAPPPWPAACSPPAPRGPRAPPPSSSGRATSATSGRAWPPPSAPSSPGTSSTTGTTG